MSTDDVPDTIHKEKLDNVHISRYLLVEIVVSWAGSLKIFYYSPKKRSILV